MTKFLKNLEKFKLITFDITETLLNFRQSPSEEYVRIAREHGYQNIDETKLNTAFKSTFKKLAKDHPNFGYETGLGWDEWWQQCIIQCFQQSNANRIPEKELGEIANDIIDRYETAEYWIKVPEADNLISRLKKEKKIVGVVSNFDPRLKRVLQNSQFPEFNFIITSYEAGVAKPDHRIFDLAIRLAGDFDRFLLPEHALHVGNTPALDFVGAVEAGWTGALITNSANDWQQFEQIKKNHTFDSLADFVRRLDEEDIEW